MHTRLIPVPGTFNIRDLGGYATPEGHTRWRSILRADGLHRMTAEGVAELHALGVRTVIDLRRGHELEAGPNPFRDHAAVDYRHIPLFDELDLVEVARQGPNVLLTLYRRALAERQAAIRDVLVAIAEAPEGVVLFHCTAGKDRTGIIAALLLAHVGVARADIVADYAATKAQIAPLRDDLVKRVAARGDDVAAFLTLLECEPETMEAWLDHLAEQHRDVAGYLAGIGLDAAVLARLRARLVAG